jgi:hypothetical protein
MPVSTAAPADRRADRLPGSYADPLAPPAGKKSERPPLCGAEKLLLAIRLPGWGLRELGTAARLIAELDLAAADRRIVDERTSSAA